MSDTLCNESNCRKIILKNSPSAGFCHKFDTLTIFLKNTKSTIVGAVWYSIIERGRIKFCCIFVLIRIIIDLPWAHQRIRDQTNISCLTSLNFCILKLLLLLLTFCHLSLGSIIISWRHLWRVVSQQIIHLHWE